MEGDQGQQGRHPHLGSISAVVPPLPVGANKGKTGVNQVDGADVGWIYDMTTGTIRADCKDDEVDHTGKKYEDC